MSLVVFTALVGLVIAPGHFHPVLAFTSILCIAVGAGASGALNMWYEADIDALMSRTANRPIPRGRITRPEALSFVMTLAFFWVIAILMLVKLLACALLALIIFFWTPPHFWALALFRSDDYARAGVPMLPVVAGPDATRLQILLYTVVLVAVAFAPWPLGYFDAVYGLTSLVLGGGMLALAINVYRRREGR